MADEDLRRKLRDLKAAGQPIPDELRRHYKLCECMLVRCSEHNTPITRKYICENVASETIKHTNIGTRRVCSVCADNYLKVNQGWTKLAAAQESIDAKPWAYLIENVTDAHVHLGAMKKIIRELDATIGLGDEALVAFIPPKDLTSTKKTYAKVAKNLFDYLKKYWLPFRVSQLDAIRVSNISSDRQVFMDAIGRLNIFLNLMVHAHVKDSLLTLGIKLVTHAQDLSKLV